MKECDLIKTTILIQVCSYTLDASFKEKCDVETVKNDDIPYITVQTNKLVQCNTHVHTGGVRHTQKRGGTIFFIELLVLRFQSGLSVYIEQ